MKKLILATALMINSTWIVSCSNLQTDTTKTTQTNTKLLTESAKKISTKSEVENNKT